MDFTLRCVNFISMNKRSLPPARKGRPPRQTAESHAAIMDATYALLQKKSVRDLTMEEVARRAKVGKPTLYKWWPTKATLVLADRKSTRLNSSHTQKSRMPSSA